MGCTDSSQVQALPHPHSNQQSNNEIHYFFGQTSQNKHETFRLILQPNKNPSFQFSSVPKPKGRTSLPNFAQFLKLSNKYYIWTGGVNHNMSKIHSESYLLNINTFTFQKLSDMNQGRYIHSCVYIGGYVYVLGGRDFGDDDHAILRHCERIEIGKINLERQNGQFKGVWEQIQPMKAKRSSFAAFVYGDRIYCLGGYTAQFERTTIIEYLQTTHQNPSWEQLHVQLPFGLQAFSFLSERDNEIMIFGGNNDTGPVDYVFSINLLQNKETICSRKSLRTSKIMHKSYVCNQLVYLFGGNDQMQVELYPIKNTDQQFSLLPNPIFPSSISILDSFQSLTHISQTLNVPISTNLNLQLHSPNVQPPILIFGTQNQPFIISLQISTPSARILPVPLSIRLSALMSIEYVAQIKKYILFGGISDCQQIVRNQCYVYDPVEWWTSKKIGNMIGKRYAFGSAVVGKWIYAVGGGNCDCEGNLLIVNKCQRVNIDNISKGCSQDYEVQWQQIAELPQGLISPMACNYQNQLYVYGGMQKNNERSQKIHKYISNTNVWEQLSFKFPFGLQASSVYQKSQHQFIIFGGRVSKGDTAGIYGLTFINNGTDCVFEQKGQMDEAKCLHHVCKFNNHNFVMLLGGKKNVLSCYDSENYQVIEADILIGVKSVVKQALNGLRDRTLKTYTFGMGI